MTQSAQPFGVSASGFLAKPQAQIENEMVGYLLTNVNAALDLSPVSPVGQLIAIVAEKDAEVWELAQVGYNATNRAAAEGAQLDNIGALIGVPRLPATYSGVWTTCVFSQSGTYGVGSLVGFIAGLPNQTAANTTSVTASAPVNLGNAAVTQNSPTVIFASAQTLPLGAAIVVAAQSNKAYFLAAPMNGTTTGTLTAIYTGPSSGATNAQNYYAAPVLFNAPLTGATFGNALVSANALNPGNIGAFTGQVPVSGWFSVVDTSTASIGSDVELDTPYRVRQVLSLGAQGSCNLAAIAVDIVNALQAAPSPVIATVTPYENTTSFIDANGVPPYSFQVVVFDGIIPNTAQNNPIIGQQIWNNKPAGIGTFGSTSVTVNDSQGVSRTVFFTRPTQVPLYLIINAQIASTANPAQVAALINTAIVAASQGQSFTAYGMTATPLPGAPTTLVPGADVVPSGFQGVVQAQAGVVSVTSVLAGFAPNPSSGAVLHVTRNQVAVLAQAQIVVNLSVFVP